jgi:hypothetical protein
MRLNHILAVTGMTLLVAAVPGFAIAQRPVTPPNAPTTTSHRMGGMMGRMRQAMHGQGSIVGNKNTKVYHLSGDKGNMPAEKNRVYFRTEREAMAAGYHVAGTKHVSHVTTRRTHGSFGHPMPAHGVQPPANGRMNGHLPK